MISVPITVNYDESKIIGRVEVDERFLPRDHCCWVLAPKMRINEGDLERKDMDTIEFSVILDKDLKLCGENE